MQNIDKYLDLLHDESFELLLGRLNDDPEESVNQVLPLDWKKLFQKNDIGHENLGHLSEADLRDFEKAILFGDTEIQHTQRSNNEEPWWDTCAWYQPIHYFGYEWGIFIREKCLIRYAIALASKYGLAHHSKVKNTSFSNLVSEFIKAAFLSLYYHEYFHHKVESFGFRLHVCLDQSRYFDYKKKIYKPHYMTDNCLEEGMANAYAYRALKETRYLNIPEVKDIALVQMKEDFPRNPPGYRIAKGLLSNHDFEKNMNLLMGQIKEAVLSPSQNASDWYCAPDMMRPLFNITSEVYTVVRLGALPVLPTNVSPYSCSTKTMIKVCESHGYKAVAGGKGSHVKLKKDNSQTILLPGQRKDLSSGVIRNTLRSLGGYKLRDLKELVDQL